MKTKCIFAATFIVFTFFLPQYSWPQSKMIPVVVDGDEVNYSKEDERVIAKGNVVMKYKGVVLKCDEADYDIANNLARIDGNVTIESQEGTLKGRSAVYNFATKEAKVSDIRIESPPIYGESPHGTKSADNEILLDAGYITTCELDPPHYRLTSSRITVYPGEKIVAKNMLLRIGGVPVFYFPYYSHSLKDKSFPAELSPGKSTALGYYALTRWRYNFDDENRGKIHLDAYEERGIGLGVSHHVKTDALGDGLVNLYYVDDMLYERDKRNELFDLYPERNSIIPKYLENNRYRTEVSYDVQPLDNLSAKVELHKFSDEFIMKDFFWRQYEIDPHPLSYMLIDYTFDEGSLSLFAQKRFNRFFSETEYLPRLQYTLYQQAIGESPFYFESNSFVSNNTNKTAYSGTDDDAARFYTHNVLRYQKKISWLYVSPFVGLFSSFYSKNVFGDENLWRQTPQFGASFSTKLYKRFSGPEKFLGQSIEQWRHVVTPSLAYGYVHDPTASNSVVFQFDEYDNLSRAETYTFTLDNKLQARKGGKTWDVLYFSPSVIYQMHQEGKGSYFDEINTDLEFYPKQGVSLTAESKYDIPLRRTSEFETDIRFSDPVNDRYTFSLGHRYVRTTSSQGTMGFRYKLNKRLELRNYLRYEYNTKKFQEQQYSLGVDLHCWLMDLGLDVDDESNYTFWVIFKLKAFPDLNVGFDHTYNGARKDY